MFGIRCNRHQLLSSTSELWLQKFLIQNGHDRQWILSLSVFGGRKKADREIKQKRERGTCLSLPVLISTCHKLQPWGIWVDLICTAESAFKALSTCPRALERASFTCTTPMKNDRNLHKTLPDVSRITGVYSINSIFNNSLRSLAWMHFIFFYFFSRRQRQGPGLAIVTLLLSFHNRKAL